MASLLLVCHRFLNPWTRSFASSLNDYPIWLILNKLENVLLWSYFLPYRLCRITSMQVLTQLPMTSQTISVRWLRTTIQKSRIYWTTLNIQVPNIFEAIGFYIVIFILDILMGPMFIHSSLPLCSYRNRYPWAEAICADILVLIG